jgi:hypothetical protein
VEVASVEEAVSPGSSALGSVEVAAGVCVAPVGGAFESVLICCDVFDRVGAGLRGVDLYRAGRCGCAPVHNRLDAEVDRMLARPSGEPK